MKNGKLIFGLVAALMVLALSGVTLYYWYNNANYVSTEDAYVDAALIRVGPDVSGRILDIYVNEGDEVRAGQPIARLDDILLPIGANPDLTVVRSPVAGTVVKRLANPGEMTGAGQPVVMVADLDRVYLTVNIEETKLGRLRQGLPVDFTVDGIPGVAFEGRVDTIGRATTSTFSLLPTRSTSGTFVKVVQRVPVKVVFQVPTGTNLTLGTSASVRIHLR